MSIVIVAVFRPIAGARDSVVDAFREVAPLVHQESGCELYAVHVDTERVVIVERWTSQQDIDAHAAGAPLQRLNELTAHVLLEPYSVYFLENIPLGDPLLGTIR